MAPALSAVLFMNVDVSTIKMSLIGGSVYVCADMAPPRMLVLL